MDLLPINSSFDHLISAVSDRDRQNQRIAKESRVQAVSTNRWLLKNKASNRMN